MANTIWVPHLGAGEPFGAGHDVLVFVAIVGNGAPKQQNGPNPFWTRAA